MQKKRKREKTDEGPLHSPATAPGKAPGSNGSEKCDMELTCEESKVSGIIFPFLRGLLPV